MQLLYRSMHYVIHIKSAWIYNSIHIKHDKDDVRDGEDNIIEDAMYTTVALRKHPPS